jgi:hypothetical protein
MAFVESESLIGRQNAADVTHTTDRFDLGPPHEMSYPTKGTLQDGWTRPQESAKAHPHKGVHFDGLSSQLLHQITARRC